MGIDERRRVDDQLMSQSCLPSTQGYDPTMPQVTSSVSSLAVSCGANFGLSKKCLGCCRCQSPPRSTTRSRATTWGSLRSEEHTSELQSLMRISYAAFRLQN